AQRREATSPSPSVYGRALGMRPRLLVESRFRLADVTDRSPRMGRASRHDAVAEVLRGYAAMRRGMVELVRGLVVEARRLFEVRVHRVASCPWIVCGQRPAPSSAGSGSSSSSKTSATAPRASRRTPPTVTDRP